MPTRLEVDPFLSASDAISIAGVEMSTAASEYCALCGNEHIRQEKRRMEFTIRGEVMLLDVPVKVCQNCGVVEEEPTIDAAEMAFARYREQRGLLTPEDIKRIRQRYHLSQKSLAVLLGMSEATINRYEGGGLQDEAHDQAIRACENLDVMRDLLNRRGSRLSPGQRKRVDEALNGEMRQPSDEGGQRLHRSIQLD